MQSPCLDNRKMSSQFFGRGAKGGYRIHSCTREYILNTSSLLLCVLLRQRDGWCSAVRAESAHPECGGVQEVGQVATGADRGAKDAAETNLITRTSLVQIFIF